MYGLLGSSQNIKNIYRLSVPFVGSQKIATTDDLKVPYLSFLNQYQPNYRVPLNQKQVVTDFAQRQVLLGAFGASQINDLQQENMIGSTYNREAEQLCCENLIAAKNRMAQLNSELNDLFDLTIHSILLCGSSQNSAGMRARGGTSSKCVGLIWLTMEGHLSPQDIVEMMIHELTHNLVFINELNSPQFDYDLLNLAENWAQSSILNRKRPMDKVIHSIIVAHEILFARKHYLPNEDLLKVHPESGLLKQNTLASITSVLNHPRRDLVCKPGAIQLVTKTAQSLINL
jgi:hypothetical protein